MASKAEMCQENGRSYPSSSKLKVLFLASEWGSSKGGLSTINRELAINVAKYPEVDVTFFVPQCNDEDKRAARDHEIDLVKAERITGMDELQFLSFPPRDIPIDVVVGHGVKLGPQAQAIKRSHKCKWVQVVHTAPEELGMHKKYPNPISSGQKKHQTEVELCERADFVVTIGPKLNKAFLSYLSSCKRNEVVFDFTPGIFSEFSEVSQVPVRTGPFQVLIFGRGDAEDFSLKGFDIAAKAVAALSNTRLMFVGAPEGKLEEVKNHFLECGVHANNLTVRSFLQNREDMKSLLCEVDLVVMPSRTEGFGLTGLEALSAGLPILVSRNSGFGEALNKVLFGSYFVINSDIPQVWANAIECLQAKGRSKRLNEFEVLRSLYANMYSWEKQSKELVRNMFSVVQAGSSLDCQSRTPQQTDVSTGHRPAGLSLECQNRTPQQTDVSTGHHPGIVPVSINLDSATFQKKQSRDLKSLMKEMGKQFLDTMADDFSNEELPNCLRCYLEGVRQCKVREAIEGSLRITLECRTLEILESLWEDYCSGHLNAVAEEYLLTDDIKRRFHVESIKLKTTILEEDYLACKLFLQAKAEVMLLQNHTQATDETWPQSSDDPEPTTLHLEVNYRDNLSNMERGSVLQQVLRQVPSEESSETEVVFSPVEELPQYLQNVKVIHGSRSTEESENTLQVAVECTNLDMLECLWHDYCSGHLNTVAEKCLLTDDIKRRFHVESVKFQTTILEEDYLACKAFLLKKTEIKQGTAGENVLSLPQFCTLGADETRTQVVEQDKTRTTHVEEPLVHSTERIRIPAVEQTHTQSAERIRIPAVQQTHTQSADETRTQAVKETHSQSAEAIRTHAFEESHNQSAEETGTHAVEERHIQSAQETRTQAVEETHSQSVEETRTQVVEETHSQSAEETWIPPVEKTHTEFAEENRTLAFEDTHINSPEETRTQAVEETHNQSAEETRTPDFEETRTQSAEETGTQAVEETHIQSPKETRLQTHVFEETSDKTKETEPIFMNTAGLRILVTGLTDDITKTDLMIYFQSTRDSGGGDVKSIDVHLDHRNAIVTFEEEGVAERVFHHSNHSLRNCPFQVYLLCEQLAPSNQKQTPSTLQESDIPGVPTTSEQEKISDAPNSGFDDQQKDPNNGRHERMEPSQSFNDSAAQVSQCTIETGLPRGATDDVLINNFENTKRSKGGPVSIVIMNPELQTCQITFESADDAVRTVEHCPHNLSGTCLHVSLFEKSQEQYPDDSEENAEDFKERITIVVSGISAFTTKDTLRNYFENARRSGGGEIHNIDYNDDGETVITFLEVQDLQRLLVGTHSIDKKPVKVTHRRLDPVRILIRGLSKNTTEDCLTFYLEKFSGDASVKEVLLGANNNALVVFETQPDFQSLFSKVHKDTKGLDESKPRLERVPICTSVLVTGLRDATSDDTIQLYFENEKRSGGRDVSHVERKGKDEALVTFNYPTTVQKVIQKRHTLEGKELKVTPHYPFFQNTATQKTEIAFDPDVFGYIQMSHERELQMVLEECKVQVELSTNSEAQLIVVSSTESKPNSGQSWKERVERLESFLQSFKKVRLDIAFEIFDEMAQRWGTQRPIEEPCNLGFSFDAHRRRTHIIGKVADVDREERKMQELIREVTDDTELMKSVVQVVEDSIPKSKLTLLEMSGICERLQNEHRHLSIAIDTNRQSLSLKGTRSVLQEVRIEVLAFISKIVEQTTELPAKIVNVLKKPQVSRFIQDILKQNSIQAVVLYDQRQSSNEVQIVGVDSKNVEDVENLLRTIIREESHHLSAENARVLQSRFWKDFQSSIASQFKVGLTVDDLNRTIWVSGISNDVQECSREVKTFLEKNTILRTRIPIEHGTTRFLTEVWKAKLDDIKRELADYSIDLKFSATTEGIEIFGTAKGLQICLPRLHAVVSAVHRDSLSIDKPGMKKLFLEGKGPLLLKETEEKHRCVILTSKRTKDEAFGRDLVAEENEVESVSELVCSYVSKEEKKISVFKGDITKDRVDAIVNATNANLHHIEGLARNIVQAGGKEIQDECTAFVRKNGNLLEGQTMVSNAGRLPCNKVIHTVGLRWDNKADRLLNEGHRTKQERFLKWAITNSLNEAATLRSIAIPAVSSGIFGFPRDLCAEIIIDAVLDFCRENPHCHLSEIHLINHDDDTVSAFANEMKKRFAEDRNFKERNNPRSAAAFGLANNSETSEEKMKRTSRSFITEGIHITVKVGNLAKEQADVLVGTAASNLNLNQNPCAKSLSQAAGPSLQQECTKIGHVAVGEVAVINQPGNLNCKAVIFAICPRRDSGKGKKVLKSLLTKCLQTASTQGMMSIAFPAIGTGMLQFPCNEVAEIYFDEVMSYNQKNPMTSLKEVRFVLHDQDDPTIQAFKAELKKRNASNASNAPLPVSKKKRLENPSRDFQAPSFQAAAFTLVEKPDPDYFETNVGALFLKAQPGDITAETTDAIVVFSNKEFDIGLSGEAGAAIVKSGGPSIQQECSQKDRQKSGSVVVTNAGNLKARYILHIVPSKHPNVKSIKTSVLKCLQEAEKKGLSSISFPAIETGNLGMSATDCAHAILSAIREFSAQEPTSMQLIRIITFQNEMIKSVWSAIEEASGEKPGIIRRVVAQVGDLLGLGDSDKSFDLVIFAGCKEDLQGAVDEINVMRENATNRVIEEEAITDCNFEDVFDDLQGILP